MRAMNPSFALVVSTFGALAAGPVLLPDEPLASDFELLLPEEQPWANKDAAVAAPAVIMNCRLEKLVIAESWMLFCSLDVFPIRDVWEVKRISGLPELGGHDSRLLRLGSKLFNQ